MTGRFPAVANAHVFHGRASKRTQTQERESWDPAPVRTSPSHMASRGQARLRKFATPIPQWQAEQHVDTRWGTLYEKPADILRKMYTHRLRGTSTIGTVSRTPSRQPSFPLRPLSLRRQMIRSPRYCMLHMSGCSSTEWCSRLKSHSSMPFSIFEMIGLRISQRRVPVNPITLIQSLAGIMDAAGFYGWCVKGRPLLKTRGLLYQGTHSVFASARVVPYMTGTWGFGSHQMQPCAA